MKRIGWLSLLLSVVVLIGGCNNSGHNQNTSDLRVLNAVVDAEPLDVLVDDNAKATAVAFQSTSSYAEFDSGTRTLKVRSSVNGAILWQKSSSLGSGANYTVMLYGRRGSLGSIVMVDDTTDPSSGTFKIRVAGLSQEAASLDLYVTPGDIAASPATLVGAGFGAVTDFVEVAGGTYILTLAVASTKEIVFQSQPQSLAAGSKLTLAVLPTGGGKLANAVLLNGSGGTFMANSLARVKAVNAIPDSTSLTFKADGETLLSNVPYQGSSSYVRTAAAARTLRLEASNVPGVAIATSAQTLGPARDYTVAAAGTLSAPELVMLTDDNSVPNSAAIRMRFVNLRNDPAAADVTVNFASQASGLAYKAASAYMSLAATTTSYTVTFATPGGVAVIASLETGELDAGGVYTAYLFGGPGGAQAKLVRDR